MKIVDIYVRYWTVYINIYFHGRENTKKQIILWHNTHTTQHVPLAVLTSVETFLENDILNCIELICKISKKWYVGATTVLSVFFHIGC